MSTMYCECEVNSLATSGKKLEFTITPVGTFKLSFRHDDKRIEYAVFSDNKELSTLGKDAGGMLLLLDDGKLKAEYLDAKSNTIISAMLISSAVAKSKILIGVDDLIVKPINVVSAELR